MPTVGPAADSVSRGPAPAAAAAAAPAPAAPAPAQPSGLLADTTTDQAGVPAYKARLRDLLLARLSPVEADLLRDTDVDDAIAAARQQLRARERFSAGLELGTGLVVDVVA
jgi:hypothetical protein